MPLYVFGLVCYQLCANTLALSSFNMTMPNPCAQSQTHEEISPYGGAWPACTEPWPHIHPTSLGWTGTSTASQASSPNISGDLPNALVANLEEIPAARFQSLVDSKETRRVEAVVAADECPCLCNRFFNSCILSVLFGCLRAFGLLSVFFCVNKNTTESDFIHNSPNFSGILFCSTLREPCLALRLYSFSPSSLKSSIYVQSWGVDKSVCLLPARGQM